MTDRITLSHFNAAGRQYHIYRIQNSKVAHKPHYHDYFQVCFVTRGEILHGRGSREVVLGPGDAFIVPPGFIHSIRFHNTRSEMYSLSFEPGLLSSMLIHTGLRRFLEDLQSGKTVRLRVMPDQDRRKMLQNLLDCLVLQQQTRCEPELSPAGGIVASILYLLAQSYYSHPENADRAGLPVPNDAVVECMAYIDRNFRSRLDPEELARQFGLSRSTLCTRFPQVAGMSPGRYIAQKRISEAQLLIRSRPELPLARIGELVGYEDSTTFYRNFLRVAGVAPAKYRQLCNESG